MNFRLIIATLAALSVASAASIDDPEIPGPSFEEYLSLRSVGSAQISPDGQQVLFTVTTTDWEKNRYDTEIWLARRGESPFQLTRTAGGSSTAPRWSPDGLWIAFLADRGEKGQIHLIRPNGGEAQAITAVKEGIGGYQWAPDSRRIAFISTEAESQEMKDRKDRFGAFEVEDEEYRQSHLWVVEVQPDPWPAPSEVPCRESAGGDKAPEAEKESGGSETPTDDCVKLPEPERLTEGEEFSVTDIDWSPDGRLLAVEHRDRPGVLSFATADISILNLETGELRPLVETPGYDGGPVWSPDGGWIAYGSSDGNTTSNFYSNNVLFKIAAGGGDPIRLAANFDERIGGLDWTPAGIHFVAWQKTRRSLFQVDPETGAVKIAARGPERIWSVDFSRDGRTAALSGHNDTGLTEVYRTSLESWEPEAVTRMSQQIEDWELGSSEVVSWTSRDGARIEGVLHKPPDYDSNQRYPLFVGIHGGPAGISYPSATPGYVYPIIQWLAKGAVVLQPNYRGSAGYGERFRSLNVRNLGVGDAWDVLSGVDHLVEQGIADPDRMGAMGWSQGGYISAFLATHSNRFKAISVGAGISNWVTYYVNTDIHPFTRQYLKATPWDDPEIYAVTSPMTNIKNASTPTLIQHGEFDRRVPIPNAYELYQGLEDVGVETKLIVYKGFGHGINKPKERLAALQHNWDWFLKYVW